MKINLMVSHVDPPQKVLLIVVKGLQKRRPDLLLVSSEGSHQVSQARTWSLVSLLPLGLTSLGGAGHSKVPLDCGSS